MKSRSSKPRGAFPSRHPIEVNENVWFYEYPGSIHVVISKDAPGRIPLRQLARTVDRYRKHLANRRANG